MNPELLVKELVQQNKLLKETISNFPTIPSRDDEQSSPSDYSFEINSESSSRSSPVSPDIPVTLHQSAIEVLLDLLDRQESRLNLLEQFGRSALLESNNDNIPIFRGLPSCQPSATTPSVSATIESQIDVKEWTKLILNRINCLKSLNSSSHSNSKEIIKFIYNKLDLEPRELMQDLLERNRVLVLKKFPHEVPLKFRYNKNSNQPTIITDEDLLFEYPFKLYLLRYPKALLNLINSKFSSQQEKPEEVVEDGNNYIQSLNALTIFLHDC